MSYEWKSREGSSNDGHGRRIWYYLYRNGEKVGYGHDIQEVEIINRLVTEVRDGADFSPEAEPVQTGS